MASKVLIGGALTEKGQLCFLQDYRIDIIYLTRRQCHREKSFLHQGFTVEDRTYKEIAEELGCSRTMIKNFLCLYGISKK